MTFRIAPIAASLVSLLLLAGCGHSSNSSSSTSSTPARVYGITISADGPTVYAANSGTSVIEAVTVYPPAGGARTIAGTTGQPGSTDGNGTSALFNQPNGIAFSNGNLFIADTLNTTIRKLTASSPYAASLYAGVQATTGASNASPGTFYQPAGIATYTSGSNSTVYIADTYNNLIRSISATGVITTVAGSGSVGSANGIGIAASFRFPWGIAVDPTGTNLYIADHDNHLIRQIVLATGQVNTLAGTGTAGYANLTGTGASFKFPTNVASDGTSVYVSDAGNNAIRQIVIATGVTSTLAGSLSGTAGTADGTGTAATFNVPAGLAYDPVNLRLYVTDNDGLSLRYVNLNSGTGTVGAVSTFTAVTF